ncbi:MAG: polyprenyl synthetase family protein [Candidatus Eiseniibacteriota bacterium]
MRPPRSAVGSIWTGALAVRHRAFERWFRRQLPPSPLDWPEPRRLYAAMRYAALSPGKRLRPMLVLTACEAAGGPWRSAFPAALAVELVHAFSLVHDDLPCMDDDDYRRGRLTTHKKFGEAIGVLAGDALLAEAFAALGGLADRGVPPARTVRAMATLAIASGHRYLIGGQVLDLEAEGRPATRDAVQEIHGRKTGALIGAALELGAIVAGAPPEDEQALGLAGQHLGSAFQIRDDLLDLRSTMRVLGKRTGSDARRGKATYPRAVGVAAAERAATTAIRLALEGVDRFGPRARNLRHLIETMAGRER